MDKNRAQIAISFETRAKLFEEKRGPTDTYDKVISRLLSEK